jgi:S-DNA-T family DNA segregation ATPase FtsK/SpoIIIE
MKNHHKQAISQKKRKILSPHMRHRLNEGMFLLALTFAIFLLISLMSFHGNDPSWSSTGTGHKALNWGGRVGAYIADILLTLFGAIGYVFPFLILLASWLSLNEIEETKKSHDWAFKLFGWFFVIASCCGLTSFYSKTGSHLPAYAGGIFGDILGKGLSVLFNKVGSTLIFITTLLCGITFVSGLSWFSLIDRVGERVYQSLVSFYQYLTNIKTKIFPKKSVKIIAPTPIPLKRNIPIEPVLKSESLPPAPKPVIVTKVSPVREKKKMEVYSDIKLAPGNLPDLSLLNPSPPLQEKAFSSISFEELSQLVEQRLSDFGVSVKVVAVHPGPIITRFELDLAPGIKVSKITGLAKDIARSLSTVSVRIVEVIPGKSVIGLEVPNENRELVTLRDIFESPRYTQSRSPVSLVLGKDISGNPLVTDLTKMPHLLVAGTTGSGKSVSLNAMVLSILFKSNPSQLRFIMIDPKMLELSVYDGIPHLLTPVITDMKDASNALRWCVAEMDKRYRLMASLGVRNLSNYNQKVSDAIKQNQPIAMPGTLVTDAASAKAHLEPFPLIVVIVDELADMMMVVGKKVEDLIARIAQKARAAGIHLILATQRPSVDVITGLIKANIPTRIAFQVSSRIDSRTILDQQGAEQLLGHGDMLYLPPGAGVPVRVHGAYVADEEVHRVVAAWRSYGEPDYLTGVTDEGPLDTGSAEGGGASEQDPLYDEAVRIVIDSRRASISLVQRRLRIGYNRAARMMETMETSGVVSSMDNTGSREVLVPSSSGMD